MHIAAKPDLLLPARKLAAQHDCVDCVHHGTQVVPSIALDGKVLQIDVRAEPKAGIQPGVGPERSPESWRELYLVVYGMRLGTVVDFDSFLCHYLVLR